MLFTLADEYEELMNRMVVSQNINNTPKAKRKKLFAEIKDYCEYLGINYEASQYFRLSNKKLEEVKWDLEDKYNDLEHVRDYRAMSY